MSHWLDQLREELARRSTAHLLRHLRTVDRCARVVHREGRSLLNLAGNDYLALATYPKVAEAVIDAARRFGVGAGASRLVTGHLEIHEKLEKRLAHFKHAEAALLLPTGYMANLAALTALAGEGDLVAIDKLNHASLIDAARFSGADVRVFPHRQVDKLKRLLERSTARRRIIVTDSVFSMDGDCADLPALCELRDRYEAILIVDEAHGTGVLGRHGSGLAEEQGVSGAVDVTISTASKALGSLGGVISASQLVIDTLINSARPVVYTTAAPPTQAAAIEAALDVVRDEPERRVRLRVLSENLRSMLRENGWPVATQTPATPIVPLIVGESSAALAISERLEEQGFLVPAIRPPTVSPGSARLRITVRCDLLDEDVERLVAAVGRPG